MVEKYNSERHKRRSIRLRGYDYRCEGAYYVTICTKVRECLFGDILNGVMGLNKYGEIAEACIKEIPDHFPFIDLDYMVVMPNHLHVILIVNNPCRGTACRAPTVERFGSPVNGSIPTIIRSYKSAVTKQINETRYTPGISVWQRNYYEHIIRDDLELNHIREYILNNPLQWESDENNPINLLASGKKGAKAQSATGSS